MVSILVLHTFEHLARQLVDDFQLTFGRHRFQRFLDYPAAVHLHCQVHDMAFDCLHQLQLLFVGPVFKEFLKILFIFYDLNKNLNDIIAEHVGHEGLRILNDLIKNELLLFDVRTLQLLLNKPKNSGFNK